ncbi:MAG: isocitrate/isopropylmalate dehydrogenase family protein [Patescibacteria group bacterium]
MKVTVLPGEGIGLEVIPAAMRVVDALGLREPIVWEPHLIGQPAIEAYGVPLPQLTLDSIRRNKVALKGPTGTTVGGGHRSYNVRLREEFKLYANVRPVESMAGLKTRWSDTHIDIVCFRENLEDLYCGEERMVGTDAEAISRITVHGTKRIARYAFEYARKNNRKKVTTVHKANILKMTHGLFLDIARAVAKEYPEIEHHDLIADAFLGKLINHPDRFDCILLPNFVGDLVTDVCAEMVGGLGFAPGGNFGTNQVIFEAVHGTAPDIAGKGVANPTSAILSAAMMLEHLGYSTPAVKVRAAVNAVLQQGTSVTGDVNPVNSVSTMEFTDAVISVL